MVGQYGAGRHHLFPGGFAPARAFEEARWCYVNGQFIGCVLLCKLMLEHVLAAHFSLKGEDEIVAGGFNLICEKAVKERLISQEEHDAFQVLRTWFTQSIRPSSKDDSHGQD